MVWVGMGGVEYVGCGGVLARRSNRMPRIGVLFWYQCFASMLSESL